MSNSRDFTGKLVLITGKISMRIKFKIEEINLNIQISYIKHWLQSVKPWKLKQLNWVLFS
jgi:hypothetical protein